MLRDRLHPSEERMVALRAHIRLHSAHPTRPQPPVRHSPPARGGTLWDYEGGTPLPSDAGGVAFIVIWPPLGAFGGIAAA